MSKMEKIKKEIEKICDKKELNIIKKLNTPKKIQDFLDEVPFNFERGGDTYMSPLKMLKEGEAHCFEGALFANLCLKYNGIESYIIDLKVKKSAIHDSDHTLCIFKINNFLGAISKTNHSVLRWRDPIYKNIRELALSYFHEYFLEDGGKTLESYSKPFNVWEKFGINWINKKEDLDEIAESLDKSPHLKFVPKENAKFIRKVGQTEIDGMLVEEW